MSGKMMNKLLNFIGLEENILEDPNENEIEDNKKYNQEDLIQPNFKKRDKKGKVVNIHSPSYIKVVVYQPLTYDDTQNIVENLKSRKPIVVNLDALEQDLAQRVLDFMSGSVYALDGTIQKVSRNIFVLVPSNIDIIGNIPEDLKGKSFYTLGSKQEKE